MECFLTTTSGFGIELVMCMKITTRQTTVRMTHPNIDCILV